MLTDFFLKLREGGVPASVKEYLTLMEALRSMSRSGSLDEFYYLSRACLVKDESNYDKFDRVFGAYFKGIAALPGSCSPRFPKSGCASKPSCC